VIEPGIYYDIDHDAYHALTGYVSNSYLSRLNICPAAAKVPQEETAAMLIGSAFHSFVLDGPDEFSLRFAVAPECDRRTKAGKALFDDFQNANAGKQIIAADDFLNIRLMDEAVKSHPLAKNMIAVGRNEVSMFWEDSFSGLQCKARADKIVPEQRTIIDLKKTKDASPHGFQSSVVHYGYHRQAAFYLDGANKITGNGFDAFAFIAVEEKEPYRVEVYTLKEPFIERGRVEYRMLMMQEIRCREANHWPNYTSAEVTELELPKYLSFTA